MIELDGSRGEGGGQIIRTALSLAMITGKAFRIRQIRTRRKRPGLQRQHLTAVLAAREISRAEVSGASLDSRELVFHPGPVTPGTYCFRLGTAGSTSLVLQTILPPLLCASSPSVLTLEGGTHNPMAPPFDFLRDVFLARINCSGPQIDIELDRYGFYPAGGGRISTTITPAPTFQPFELTTRGRLLNRHAQAVIAHLPRHIAERELAVLRSSLDLEPVECSIRTDVDSAGPGNVVLLRCEWEHITEIFTAFGQKGIPAEQVASTLAEEARRHLATTAPVGIHLADQLLLPLVLAGGGRFVTLPLTAHSRTNMEVIHAFMGECIHTRKVAGGLVEIGIEK